MKNYIGTKIIQAEPMDEFTFIQKVKKEIITHDQENQHGYHVLYPDGYNSWSPKVVFENAYREITFSELELIILGASLDIDGKLEEFFDYARKKGFAPTDKEELDKNE